MSFCLKKTLSVQSQHEFKHAVSQLRTTEQEKSHLMPIPDILDESKADEKGSYTTPTPFSTKFKPPGDS